MLNVRSSDKKTCGKAGHEKRALLASETTHFAAEQPNIILRVSVGQPVEVKDSPKYVPCFCVWCRLIIISLQFVCFETVWHGLCCLLNHDLLYVSKFGQLNHFADNLKSQPDQSSLFRENENSLNHIEKM